MNVFILEDNILQQQRLRQIVCNVLLEQKWSAKTLTTTTKPDFLLEKVRKTVGQNIYFLDIDIHGARKKGLELAQKIRSLDPFGIIAFITTHSEFAPVTYAYKVSAFDFIDKAWSDTEIKKHLYACFEVALQQQQLAGQKELFFFENKYASFQVPFSDILYFETTEISHKLRLICNCRLVSFYGTLEEIEKMDHRFCQVHRSFVVNLTNIVEIDRPAGLIYFNHQQQCFISRRKLKITLRKLKEFNKSIDL